MSRGVKIGIAVSILLIVVGLILFGSVMVKLDWDFTKLSTAKYETREHTVAENYESLRINVGTANVKLLPSENGDTRVVCYEQEKVIHQVEVKDGVLTVEVKDTRKWYQHIGIFFGSPKVTLYLPAGMYKDFEITADTGSVEIPGDFSADSIAISTDTGRVTCQASAADTIRIKVSTGSIRLKDLSAGEITLTSSTGGVTVTRTTCAGALSVRVSTGKTVLEDVACQSLVSKGDTGSLRMKNVTASKGFLIERDTGNVTFEGCDAAEIKVTTDTGNVTGSLLTEKTFVTYTDTGKTEVPNTAGGRCEITTNTGNIKIWIAVQE